MKEQEVLEILASIESNSTHPLALGINNYVKENNIKKSLDLITEDISGYGVKGRDNKNTYYACNSKLLKKLDIINSYKDEEDSLTKDGCSVIYLVKNKKVIALFGLKDIIRKESIEVVSKLKDMNIDVIMLSGDNNNTCLKIGNELNIDNIISEKTPKEKCNYISKLIESGKIVMMVGDGINDAPSLTLSSIGVSLKGAVDIATNSSDVIISNNNLLKIIDLINNGKSTIKNIKQNLFWAFIYNICMIPLASGIFGLSINPMIACLMMILSSLTVTINALRLGKK